MSNLNIGTIEDCGINPEALPTVPADLHLNLILISFCNAWPVGHTLALLDSRNGAFRWVPLRREARLFGTNGVRPFKGGLIAIEQTGFGGAAQIGIFGPDLSLVEERQVEGIGDAHDVEILEGDALAVVATAHDQIVRVDTQGSVTPIWAASDRMTDTQHVNSIAALNGRLYATAFGPKPAEGWRFAAGGYIVDCESGAHLHDGIRHPHSLIAAEGRLWWCESATSKVWSWGATDGARVEMTAKGYLRALCVTPDFILSAASARRDASRLHGVGIPIPNPAQHVEGSWLYIMDRRSGEIFARRIDHMGGEIFAIAAAPEGVPGPSQHDMAGAVAQRIGTAQRLAAEADQIIRNAQAPAAAESEAQPADENAGAEHPAQPE